MSECDVLIEKIDENSLACNRVIYGFQRERPDPTGIAETGALVRQRS